MKFVFASLLLLFWYINSFSQSVPLVKDTSYTTYSALQKIRKNYPFAKPVVYEKQDLLESQTDLVYCSIGDRELHFDMHRLKKQDGSQLPGVILIHGGGWSSGDKSMLTPLAQQLAVKGFVTFNVEYRLAQEALYPAAVIDIQNAVTFFQENASKFGLDPARMAILGCSAGAQLATLIGTIPGFKKDHQSPIFENREQLQAIVNIDGIVAFIHPESAEGKAASIWLGGSADEVPEVWREASPLTYVNKKTPPVLFINSSIPRFHAGRDDFISLLNKYGTYSEIHTLDDSPHSFWLFHPWFDPTIEYIVSFLNKVLKP